MSRRTRRSPGAGPGIASRDAAKHLDQYQHDTGPTAAGTFQSAYRWAAAHRRRTLELELVDAWVAQATRRAA